MNIAQITAIILLLQAFGVSSSTVANIKAILEPTPIIIHAPNPMTQIPFTTPNGASATPVAAAPDAQGRIEIVSPISGKGLGRQYAAYDWSTYSSQNVPDSERPAGFKFPDESNYIALGAVLYDANGNALGTNTMTITATDESQNKVEQGTGAVMSIYVNGTPNSVPVYPFQYNFQTAGDHTITFTADNGLTASVTLTAK